MNNEIIAQALQHCRVAGMQVGESDFAMSQVE